MLVAVVTVTVVVVVVEIEERQNIYKEKEKEIHSSSFRMIRLTFRSGTWLNEGVHKLQLHVTESIFQCPLH